MTILVIVLLEFKDEDVSYILIISVRDVPRVPTLVLGDIDCFKDTTSEFVESVASVC